MLRVWVNWVLVVRCLCLQGQLWCGNIKLWLHLGQYGRKLGWAHQGRIEMEKFLKRVSGAGLGWYGSIYKEDTYRLTSCTHLAGDIHRASSKKTMHCCVIHLLSADLWKWVRTHYSQAEKAKAILSTPACLEFSRRNHSLPKIFTPVICN